MSTRPPLGAAKVKLRRRGDKRHRTYWKVISFYGSKNMPLPYAIEWAHPRPPRPPNPQTGGQKTPLKLQPNRRPQIEHIMWDHRAAWSPLWWWPCMYLCSILIAFCSQLKATSGLISGRFVRPIVPEVCKISWSSLKPLKRNSTRNCWRRHFQWFSR